MEVYGNGVIASLLRAMFKGMNVTHEIDNFTSTGGFRVRVCDRLYTVAYRQLNFFFAFLLDVKTTGNTAKPPNLY